MAGEIAFSDYGTKLHVKDSTYALLFGIKGVPASGSSGGTIEVTEMHSPTKQHIPDRIDIPDQDFIYNRTEENFTEALALCDGTEHEFLVEFSDGSGTYIKGIVQTWKNEFSVGSVQEATLHIVATTIENKTSEQMSALLPQS